MPGLNPIRKSRSFGIDAAAPARRALVLFGLVVLLAFSSLPALARPGEDILDGLLRDRPLVQSLEAVFEDLRPFGTENGTPAAHDPSVQDPSVQNPAAPPAGPVRLVVHYRSPESVRFHWSGPGREEIHLATGNKTMSLVNGQAAPAPWPLPYLLVRLMLDKDPGPLLDLMVHEGIDPDRTASGRLKGASVRIIGAAGQDLVPPQAWFDDQGRLVRLILPGARTMPAYDIQPIEYKARDSGLQFPSRLDVRVDFGPVGRLDLASLTVNPTATDLEKVNPDTPVTPPPAPEDDEPDTGVLIREIHQQMEWLRGKYR